MRRYTIEIKGKEYIIDVDELAGNRFQVQIGDEVLEVQLSAEEGLGETGGTSTAVVSKSNGGVTPAPRSAAAPQSVAVPQARAAGGGGKGSVTAPMPGTILSVEVAPGAKVTRGQTVAVLEAMKMKNAIKAPQDGVVTEVLVQAGQKVSFGDTLVKLGEA